MNFLMYSPLSKTRESDSNDNNNNHNNLFYVWYDFTYSFKDLCMYFLISEK